MLVCKYSPTTVRSAQIIHNYATRATIHTQIDASHTPRCHLICKPSSGCIAARAAKPWILASRAAGNMWSPDLSSPPGNLDGAIARGSGGGSAGGRHLAQAPGQPGAACAPLGEQAPPFAALIRHRTGGGWIFGVFSIRRQSSTERGRGRWESRPRDPGTRTRPRGSPGLNAEVRNSKLAPLHGLASRAAGAPI